MAAVAQGGDRQSLHEAIRQHSQAAGAEVKMHGRSNDLIQRLENDPRFHGVDMQRALDVKSFVGRAPQQVAEFIDEFIDQIRARYREHQVAEGQVSV